MRMWCYWEVPVIEGVEGAPTSDELKHFGAALASFGSTPLFHMIGVTPEAPSLAAVFDGNPPAATPITRAAIDELYAAYGVQDDRSEERVVGKECVCTGRFRGSPYPEKKKKLTTKQD